MKIIRWLLPRGRFDGSLIVIIINYNVAMVTLNKVINASDVIDDPIQTNRQLNSIINQNTN